MVNDRPNSGRTSNSRGYYELSLEPGTHTITFSYMGYETWQEEIEIMANEHQFIDVSLYPTETLLADLLVQAPPVSRDVPSPGTIQVPLQYMNSTASLLHSDVFRSIQLLPGVMASSDFSSGLHIRGGSPDQTLVLVDGVTVYNPTHFYGFFSTFNPDIVDRVTLHKGTYPASYGGRLGSVVDVSSRQGYDSNTGGSVSLGLLSSRASIQGPHGAGSYMVAFRRSTLEPTLAVLRNIEEDNIPDHFHFYDLNASINFNAGSKDHIRLSLYNSMDDLSYPLAGERQFTLSYSNQTGAFNWERNYSDHLKSTISFSASRYQNKPAFAYGGSTRNKNNDVADYTGKADLAWKPNSRTHLQSGISAGEMTFNINEFDDKANIFSSSIPNTYAAAYVQADQRLTDQWQASAGIRGNWYSGGDYLRMEPRVSVDYHLSPRSTLQAAAGRYYQFVSLITSQSFSGFDIWLSTADQVPPSYSNQFSLGYKNKFSKSYEFEMDVYYRSMKDLFEMDPFAGQLPGQNYEDLFYYGEGYAAGLEIFLSKYSGIFNGFISYTLGTTQKRIEGVNGNLFYPPKYDRLHDLNLVTNLRLSDHWKLSSVFSYGSGQPYTRPLGGLLFVDELEYSRPAPLVVGEVNGDRLPAYHRLDVGVTRRDKLFNSIESELKLEVINVYSRKNIWFYSYSFADEEPREAVTMLPLIPSVTYSVSF
ncbi:MAG: TonB-dependent receptor plug domain-containing protein [Balneolales bacterium]